MRLPNSAHEAHAWRIQEVVPDFKLEDVWALPARGRREDFASLLAVMAALDPAHAESRATRALFSIRYRVGGWFGWDDAPRSPALPEDAEVSLSKRLPDDLRDSTAGLELRASDFTALYRTDLEWAAELANRTVHAVMHLAWVEQERDIYQGQLAVYVKPRGRLGEVYMAAIAPFRHRVVYPALMREIEKGWNSRIAR
jgi:Protein of unknown function (DUF2867)